MKVIILLLAVITVRFTTNAQSDYKFDYLLEYTDTDSTDIDYYINSKDDNYLFADAIEQRIIKDDYVIDFNVSFQGETRIIAVSPDEFENNNTKVEVVENGKTEIIENGFKCKKYVYKTVVSDDEDNSKKLPITYVFYIMEDPLNTISTFNKNEVLFSENIKFNGLPKGTIVKMEVLENEHFANYVLLKLKKVSKLEKPLAINITNSGITQYLIKKQD